MNSLRQEAIFPGSGFPTFDDRGDRRSSSMPQFGRSKKKIYRDHSNPQRIDALLRGITTPEPLMVAGAPRRRRC
jgi:hypothetical protein